MKFLLQKNEACGKKTDIFIFWGSHLFSFSDLTLTLVFMIFHLLVVFLERNLTLIPVELFSRKVSITLQYYVYSFSPAWSQVSLISVVLYLECAKCYKDKSGWSCTVLKEGYVSLLQMRCQII